MNTSAGRLNLLFLLLISVFAVPLFAQNSGTIQGTVVDSAGAVIAGASVQAIDQAKADVVRETKSGADGLFVLQPLEPSVYTVAVRATGMKELRKTDVHLDPSQIVDLGQLSTAIGSVSEQVTVEAQTPIIEVGGSDHSNVIDSRQVTETSLNGRDFQSLVKTLPGVVSNDSSDFRLAFNNTDAFHVDGQRGSQNNVFLDGAINTDVGANDGQFTQLSMDAVGEFKLQTSNFAAEYGRNAGVVLEVNTKSGTKQFHGTLYEFNREDPFDAVPFGGNKIKPELRFNQYGGNIGGPIPMPHAKDKLFFFFNYEGTKAIKPGNTQFANGNFSNLGHGYELPNPAVLTGDLSSQYTGGFICDHLDPNSPNTCTPTQYLNGQVFVPGSIKYDAKGEIQTGTPICGTVAAPCNIIPAGQLSSQFAAFAKYFSNGYLPGAVPDPNTLSPVSGVAQKFFIPYNEKYKFNKRQLVARIDYNINAKTNFFFRWVDDGQQEQYHNLFDFADYPILPEYRKKPGSSWAWNLVNVISPTMTNEFIFSYNHLTQRVDIVPGTPASAFNRDTLGFTFQQLYPNSNVDNRAPVLNNCCNGTFTGGDFRPSWHSEARMFTFTDNVTKVLGAHTVKVGAFFDYNQAGQQPVWNDSTFFDFNPSSGDPNNTGNYLGNVFTGYFNSASQSNGVFFGAFRFHQVEAFGQDSWRVNRRLTLDYGLRWAYLGPTYTVQPFFQNYFDVTRYNPAQAVTLNATPGVYFGADCSAALQAQAPSIVNNAPVPQCPGVTSFGNPFNGIVQEGHGIPPGFANHHYNNFMPRIGFSYDPTGSGKTAIRGGAGIFYERIRQNVNSFDGLGNPPLSYTPNVFNQRIDSLGPASITGVITPTGLNAFDKAGQIPVTYGYSFGVQRELPGQIGLEVAYVGNQARHLQYQYNLQALPVGTRTDLAGLSQPFYAVYKGYSNINYTKYGANSSYNGLQVKAIRRFHRDLTLTADYTFSKTIDLEDNDNGNSGINADSGAPGLTDPYNIKRDYAPAGFDRRHVFNFNYVYALPELRKDGALKYVFGGWEVSGITRFWSGAPLDPVINGNAGNFVGVVRPDLVSGASPYLKSGGYWLNPKAFARPNDGSVGNIKRNAFRGAGINNWDVSLFKNLNFTENVHLQLRLESFNVFNHTQPANIHATFNSSTAGQPASAGTLGSSGKIANYRDPRNVQLGIKLLF
jgi:hypothetical protein